MLRAAIFVFVGVDFIDFRYVLDFEVTVQGFVGEVPGGTADHSEHFLMECLEDLVVGWLAASPIALSRMYRWVAVLLVYVQFAVSCERTFISQLIFLRLSSSWRRSAFICLNHFSFSSR